jgi:hypothetical protein
MAVNRAATAGTVAVRFHMAVRRMAPARAAAEDMAAEDRAAEDTAGEAMAVADPASLVTSRKQCRTRRPQGAVHPGCGAYLRTIPD